MGAENIGIGLEELPNETLEGDKVYVRVGVEKLEVNLDATLLIKSEGGHFREIDTDRLCFAAHIFLLFVGLFPF